MDDEDLAFVLEVWLQVADVLLPIGLDSLEVAPPLDRVRGLLIVEEADPQFQLIVAYL